MNGEVIVVPYNYQALQQAGIVISRPPGQENMDPPATPFAVLDAVSRGINDSNAVAATMHAQGIPMRPERVAGHLRGILGYYGATSPAHATAIAIKQRDHMAVGSRSKWPLVPPSPLRPPFRIQHVLDIIAAGATKENPDANYSGLCDFFRCTQSGGCRTARA